MPERIPPYEGAGLGGDIFGVVEDGGVLKHIPPYGRWAGGVKEEDAWILRFAQDEVFLLLFVHKKKSFLNTYLLRPDQPAREF